MYSMEGLPQLLILLTDLKKAYKKGDIEIEKSILQIVLRVCQVVSDLRQRPPRQQHGERRLVHRTKRDLMQLSIADEPFRVSEETSGQQQSRCCQIGDSRLECYANTSVWE